MASTIESSIGNPKTSMALLKVLAENSFDSILVTDATAKGKIIYANKSFKKLPGHDPSEVIGKTPRILQGVGTDKKVIERLSLALKTGNTFEGKAINYKKNPHYSTASFNVAAIEKSKNNNEKLVLE